MKRPSLRKNVKISIIEGIFAQIYSSIAAPGSIFITKMAQILGASPIHFSILSAIGRLSDVFQLLGLAYTSNKKSLKRSVIVLAGFGRGLTFLFGFLPFMFPNLTALWFFIILFFIGMALQAMSANAWLAWVSDIVPANIRGRFFSRRSFFLLIAGLLTGYAVALFIDPYAEEPGRITAVIFSLFNGRGLFSPSMILYCFLFIFIAAAAIGIYGLFLLNKQDEHITEKRSVPFSHQLSSAIKDTNLRSLLLYGAWWMLAVGIGAPFWQPFMLQTLKLSIMTIQIYGTLSVLGSVLSLRYWGILIDKFGNKPSMHIAVIMGSINPLVWIFIGPDMYWPIFIEAFTSGIMWAGANVIATNFVLSIAPPAKKQMYSALFGATTSFSIMITMLLSGIFMPPPIKIGSLQLTSYQVLFALTGLLRFTTHIPLARIHEPRGKSFKSALYFLQDAVSRRIRPFNQPK